MSGHEEKGVRVINEEYERVLSNPDNLIMSDELQSLIDLNLDDDHTEAHVEHLDAVTLSVYSPAGSRHTLRGELSELSHNGDAYTLNILVSKVREGVLQLLELYSRTPDADMEITIEGVVNLSTSINVRAWSIELQAPHTYSLKITFGSNDAIF